MDIFAHLLSPPSQANRFYGVCIGIVSNNQDPEGLGRVKIRLPWLSDEHDSHWARMATPMAGGERGFYFLPEVEDEVLVAFAHGMIEYPYVLGCLWNGKDKPPTQNEDGKNDIRMIKSRSGHIIRLTDSEEDEKIEIIDKSAKNQIVISSKENTITISAEADITIQSTTGKLKLSGKGVEINSEAEIKIEAAETMELQAGPQLKIQGEMVDIN